MFKKIRVLRNCRRLEKADHHSVRSRAAKALGQLKDPWAVEPLIRALEGRDWQVRKSAAEALGQIGDARAVEPLFKAIWREYGEVRSAAACALAQLKAPNDRLIRALGNKDVLVRQAAARALGQWQDPEAIEALIKALGEEDPALCRTVVEVLKEVAESNPGSLVKVWEQIHSRVNTWHMDWTDQPIGSSDCVHTDIKLGMDWPKEPPKTDF